MKAALLATFLLLLAPIVVAQQTPNPQDEQAPAPVASSAPQPGHPLDQADVDVLTGKNKPQSTQYRAVPYYSINPNGTMGYGVMGYGRNRNFGLLGGRPLGAFGAGSGLVFFGRGLGSARPVVVIRP